MNWMNRATTDASADVISGILNWVCPECGGRMGSPEQPFKCQGQCGTDWRAAWERNVASTPRAASRRTRRLKQTSKQASGAPNNVVDNSTEVSTG